MIGGETQRASREPVQPLRRGTKKITLEILGRPYRAEVMQVMQEAFALGDTFGLVAFAEQALGNDIVVYGLTVAMCELCSPMSWRFRAAAERVGSWLAGI